MKSDKHEYTFDTVEGHTFLPEIMEPGGHVLDVGCRGFEFSSALAARGYRVLALDPDPGISDPRIPGVEFLPVALVHDDAETASYVTWEDRNWSPPRNGSLAREFDPFHVQRNHPSWFLQTKKRETREVPCCNLQQIMERYEIDCFELVKLGCEGSEYNLLRHWPGPISKQISAEFHDWAGANPCEPKPFPSIDSPSLKRFYEDLFSYLGRWYQLIHHVPEPLIDPEDGWRGYMDSVLLLNSIFETHRFEPRFRISRRLSKMRGWLAGFDIFGRRR